jgi:predicted nucleic acid-binding protein
LSFLIDTNVVSELRKKKRANRLVLDWFSKLSDSDIFLSVLTISELKRGIERMSVRDPRQAAVLNSWLTGLVASFGDRILPIDLNVATEWGSLPSRDTLPVIDALIGATARCYGLTVATRNLKDISRTGAVCMNPFESDRA